MLDQHQDHLPYLTLKPVTTAQPDEYVWLATLRVSAAQQVSTTGQTPEDVVRKLAELLLTTTAR